LRQDCEVCGQAAQAHHDSYYPDKWLEVHWFCPAHHREWNDKNEPTWPTIYEFHPSDHPPNGTLGRPPTPWYWKARKAWYVNLKGKRYRLHEEEAKAWETFEKILTGR
jgi:hypothetical protein